MNYVSLAIDRQPFASKSEMDESIKLHISEHGADLNDTAIEILRLLSRYAVKYPGVAFLKHATIAKAIGKSRITVIRNMAKLVNAGIVEKVSVMRSINGGNGANMYVITKYTTSDSLDDTPQPIHREEAEKPTWTSGKQANDEFEPLFSINKTYTLLDTRTLKASIPAEIYNAMAPFFNAEELYEIVGVLYRAKASIDRTIKAEDHAEYIDAFLACVRRYKSGHVRNLSAYLYRAWAKCTRAIKWRELSEYYEGGVRNATEKEAK
ncbi:helix-turn-helix domain-containing protein [Halobacillus naozhouensis]|uniref:Helix-turn-helix domain-containing protein n=1 Tax=Halobacillus naozhouensis TaxID=554880 RepID=A0ABY8J0A0_9BACI|nr:helix-turn-helix domain-containing protein [Halobacillus naozhouensis]WFT74874.1 helix-turn-helix domain-containing protein [Halobacillus naozhouensis]